MIVWRRKATFVAPEEMATADDIAMQTNYFCGEWSIRALEGDGVSSNGTVVSIRLDRKIVHKKVRWMARTSYMQSLGTTLRLSR